MALTGGEGISMYFINTEPRISGDERLARAGIARVSSEQAVGMSAKAFGRAVKGNREGDPTATAKIEGGLASGAEAHRRSTRERLGLGR